MKIDGSSPWSGMEGLNPVRAERAKTESHPNDEVSPGDDAQLSSDATLASQLTQQLNALPDIRYQKVVALQNAIRQGSYSTPADQIAEAMTNDMTPLRRLA